MFVVSDETNTKVTPVHSPSPLILVVGPSWVGDMVMSQSLYITLKQNHPTATIDVLAPAWSKPLLDAMPEVSGVINMPLGHARFGLLARRAIGKQLRKKRYDQAILLPNSWKSGLIPWFADVPVRTSWLGEMRYGLLNDRRTLDKKAMPYMVQRFVALAGSANMPVTPLSDIPPPRLQVTTEQRVQIKTKLSLLMESNLNGESLDGRPLLALCPGAEFGAAKRWPEQYYAAVASARIAKGERVLLFGSENDRPVANSVMALLSEHERQFCTSLAGQTSLSEALHAMDLCRAVVSNDSGLMHVAVALGKAVVAVYGSSSPQFTPPLGERVQALSIPVDCGPCFQRECALPQMKCLQGLSPAAVLAELDVLIQLAGS